jgi:hypothetical protein
MLCFEFVNGEGERFDVSSAVSYFVAVTCNRFDILFSPGG